MKTATIAMVLVISSVLFFGGYAIAQMIELKDGSNGTINVADLDPSILEDKGPQKGVVWGKVYRLDIKLKQGHSKYYFYLAYSEAQSAFYRLRDAYQQYLKERLKR